MKTSHYYTLLVCLVFNSMAGLAQCNVFNLSQSYDTTVTGTGTMIDPPYTFTFPKFNPAQGTLTEVVVTSIVTVNYATTLENKDAQVRNAKMRLNRIDEISGNFGDPVSSSLYMPSPSTWYGPYSLGATDGLNGGGPDFHSVPTIAALSGDTAIHENLINTVPFMGAGNISIDYVSDVTSAISGGVNIVPTPSATDQVKFILTYKYCNQIALATEITNFTVTKQGDGAVDIQWTTNNERDDRTYEVLKSQDGKKFTTVFKTNSLAGPNHTGSYQNNYLIQSEDKGDVVFRIKQTEKDGSVKYSQIRVVNLGNNKPVLGIRIYPNPVRGTATIVFHNTIRSDWQVDIFTISGQLINRTLVSNALVGKINTDNRLSRGTYVVKATNKKTQESFVERLIVQ